APRRVSDYRVLTRGRSTVRVTLTPDPAARSAVWLNEGSPTTFRIVSGSLIFTGRPCSGRDRSAQARARAAKSLSLAARTGAAEVRMQGQRGCRYRLMRLGFSPTCTR